MEFQARNSMRDAFVADFPMITPRLVHEMPSKKQGKTALPQNGMPGFPFCGAARRRPLWSLTQAGRYLKTPLAPPE
jgi:hypothetical protein